MRRPRSGSPSAKRGTGAGCWIVRSTPGRRNLEAAAYPRFSSAGITRRSGSGGARRQRTRRRACAPIYQNPERSERDQKETNMQNALMTKVVNKNKRTDLPEFRIGDTIRVHVRIKEGDKERLQAFEGMVIARHNSGLGESVTVRKTSFGQGVERIFPVNAPVIDHIDVVRTGAVRRAKLYYMRELKGKAARLKERE